MRSLHSMPRAVGVAMHLAQVHVDAAGEAGAQCVVHHVEDVFIGRAFRNPSPNA